MGVVTLKSFPLPMSLPSFEGLGLSAEGRSEEGRPDKSPGMGGLSPEACGRSPDPGAESPDKRGPSPSPPILVCVSFGGRRRGEKFPTSAAALDVGERVEDELSRCSRAESTGSPEDDSPHVGGEKGRGGRPSAQKGGVSSPAIADAAAALAEVGASPGGEGGTVRGHRSGPPLQGPEVKGVSCPCPGDTWITISESEGIC